MLRKIICIVVSLLIFNILFNISGMAREDIFRDENTIKGITGAIKDTEIGKYRIDLKGGVGGGRGGAIGGRGGGRIGGSRIGKTGGGKISSPKISTGKTGTKNIKSSSIKEPVDKYSESRYRPTPLLPPRRVYSDDDIYPYPFLSWQQRLFPNYLFGNNYKRNSTNRTW